MWLRGHASATGIVFSAILSSGRMDGSAAELAGYASDGISLINELLINDAILERI